MRNWILGILALVVILVYNFPILAWVFGIIMLIIICIIVMFILGITGAGSNETMWEVAKRFWKEIFY